MISPILTDIKIPMLAFKSFRFALACIGLGFRAVGGAVAGHFADKKLKQGDYLGLNSPMPALMYFVPYLWITLPLLFLHSS